MADSLDKHKHNGIRTYAGAEATNVILGQNGFDILVGASGGLGKRYVAGEYGTDTSTLFYKPVVRFWIAIKAIHGSDSSIIAKTLQGENLSLDGTYNITSSGNNVDVSEDDIINGCFQEIRICDAVTYVIAYRG